MDFIHRAATMELLGAISNLYSSTSSAFLFTITTQLARARQPLPPVSGAQARLPRPCLPCVARTAATGPSPTTSWGDGAWDDADVVY